ncbi:MAG: oxidoreductase [Pseudohongiella nitratireducens]|nr:oxidoreductase [Pseudohongiella nitratireducens]MDF1622647.1 oxidoreductase [Pseudohongiella nitratireducens]
MLAGKRVLVAGAGGLLGSQIVESIISEGGKVVASDVNYDALAPLLTKVGEDSLSCIEIDIANKKSIVDALQHCTDLMGGVDGAVNSAYPRNKNYGRKVFEVSYQDFTENLGLHLGGYFLFMQQCAAYALAKNESFSLVNLSSIYGVVAPKFDVYKGTNMTMAVEYAAIKSGLLHLNKYFTNYMTGTKFRVNSVSPGGILDGQDERFLNKYNSHCVSKGMLDPSDITGAINYLLSDSAQYVAGQNLIVDDGFSS